MIRLYPKQTIVGQSFAKVKKTVVPNQSLTLHQILKRFIKNEPLPVSKEGTYSDTQDIDLEKFYSEDITVRHEILEEQKERVKGMKAKIDDQNKSAMEKAKAKKKQEETDLFNKWSEQSKPTDPKV